MKNMVVMVLISFLVANTYAQKKMTPRDLAGLKGNVKSVLVETGFLEINKEKYNPDKRMTEAEDFYDQNGNIKNILRKSGSGDTVKYAYDSRGRIVEERKIDGTGFQYSKTEYRYNAKGQISETIYSLMDKTVSNYFYTYDAEGNLTEKKFVPTKESIVQDTVVQRFKDYKFDRLGNWIQTTVETTSFLDGKSNENLTITYRTIEYFK